MRWFQADVFGSAASFTGNGLAVFPEAGALTSAQMQTLTRELRQFESIFLGAPSGAVWPARIFTMDEELPFAGHPALGAAAVLHHLHSPAEATAWTLRLGVGRDVRLQTRRTAGGFEAEMDQGPAHFGAPVQDASLPVALGLSAADLDPALPVQTVSTGLPHLIVPVRQGVLERARILEPSFEARLSRHGARFVYLLDVDAREGRTWDNQGAVEDVATGSAAGPAVAYLVRHGRARAEETVSLQQGRFAGRPSVLNARIVAEGGARVGGRVEIVAEGRFWRLPE